MRSSLNFRIREDLLNDNLECIVVEISNNRSKPFLVGTWYRPPNSPSDLVSHFEILLYNIDSENSKFHLLGDLNCNMLSLLPERNTCSSELLNILDIFDFHQLITESTRITLASQTLIDLCITNSPDKITASGTLSLGISDHSLVYLVRKSSCPKWGEGNKRIIRRDFKHFNETDFMRDLNLINFDNPNEMWQNWVPKLTSEIDKHAPLKKERLGKKKSPWITPEVISKMRQRDSLKRSLTSLKMNIFGVNIKKLGMKPTIS